MKKINLAKLTLIVVILSQLSCPEAFARVKFKETLLTKNKNAVENPYFQIKSSRIQELSDEEAMEFINEPKSVVPETKKELSHTILRPKSVIAALDGVIMVVDKLIAIGLKILPAIEKGRAVVTNNPMASISVLPRVDSKDPVVHDMGGWSVPKSKHYKITFVNGFNAEVISFVYSISFQSNGTYGGKGKYLAGIRASARNISVSWGFDLDASSQLLQISNVGTQQNVVAAATVEISYTVKNWTRTITTNEAFFVAGDGRLYKLD